MKNKIFTLAAALTLAAVIGSIYAAPALAQVIKAALVQNVDEPGRHPYIFFSSIGTNITDSPAISPGKRVVLQHVSVSSFNGGGGELDVLVMPNTVNIVEGFSIPMSSAPGTGLVNTPIFGYVDAGQHLHIQANGPGAGLPTLGFLTVTGYIIDCTATSPCAAPAP
jgi:hypothetical protein